VPLKSDAAMQAVFQKVFYTEYYCVAVIIMLKSDNYLVEE